MSEDLRPRGIGGDTVVRWEPKPADGDDYTWDWHQVQSESGNLGQVEMQAAPAYDVRTGPDRLWFELSTGLYACQRQLALLQQRVAELEAQVGDWTGD